ncbi:hypothetical protein [Aquirhabdus sp.]|uniref:hypothetical protein n=1 Tax=Aquirhabdus sp. TaxID=2824160 RepID=UPI00396C79E1
MSLQLGADFPSRWLATPYAERRQCLRDLSSVCLLLDPNTDFDEWEKSLQNNTDDVEPITLATQAPIQKNKAESNAINLTPPLIDITSQPEFEKRLHQQIDTIIERSLDPIRLELRKWLENQIQQELKTLKK